MVVPPCNSLAGSGVRSGNLQNEKGGGACNENYRFLVACIAQSYHFLVVCCLCVLLNSLLDQRIRSGGFPVIERSF
jgi:hypothetical protein